MIDFLMITSRTSKRGCIEIYPKFIIKKTSDLMIRGGDFYAIWMEDRGLWSTDEQDALQMIDRELDRYAEEHKDRYEDATVKVLHMWDSENGMIDRWHKYCQKHMRDSFHMLDEKLIFSNMETRKEDYASKKLNYPLEKGDLTAYEKLMSTLYEPEERRKIEWSIGSIVAGDSKKLQKFVVLYGAAGTGKSTVLNIIQQLFDGYYAVFDAKALGSSNNSFALEAFKMNPLVAIQHDGDLSRIEDNTRLNSLVSHELMTVNEKFKSTYANRFKAFLFMGTNKPVKITDAKSGLLRRLIDVTPSGNKLPVREYKRTVKQVGFELGAIAYHCKEVYEDDPGMFDDYIPLNMLGASNDFFNFISDNYLVFKKADGVTLNDAWDSYKKYCDYAKLAFVMPRRVFKEELKSYFREYKDRHTLTDGTRVRSYYFGFKSEQFEEEQPVSAEEGQTDICWLDMKEQPSVFDTECADCIAQYSSSKESPKEAWDDVKTKLSDLDTHKLHYVRVPMSHIVIDFDITDSNGKKSPERNFEEARKWPPTYAELSKSGAGIHLHYIYVGDPELLSRVYDEHIEIKVFAGKSSLRRKLTKCNNHQIAVISSGLPLRKEKKMVNFDAIKDEKHLRNLIRKNLNKEILPNTKPSIDLIFKDLETAYNSGMKYDVTDMRNAVYAFAANSSNQANACLRIAGNMKFKSDDFEETRPIPYEDEELGNNIDISPLVFFDIEVFPNLFLVCLKEEGEGKPVVDMVNPSSEEVLTLLKSKLVGFNCRNYDNHILIGRTLGLDNLGIYELSQKIINSPRGDNTYKYKDAYSVSYTDIYDFASSGNKMSLKKLEIEMGIHHQELGFRWDEEVPEDQWPKVIEYCHNDVLATEAAFNYLRNDFVARQILADLTGMTVNDTTNTLSQQLIFGSDRTPQGSFIWRDMAQPVETLRSDVQKFLEKACPEMMAQPFGEAKSKLPYFPGYKFDKFSRKSTYKDQDPGNGGYVYAEPGMYTNVALLDVSSMHPHSAIAECVFGPKYTLIFRELVEARVAIKHEDWKLAEKMMDGKFKPYIKKVIDGEVSSKDLANALKTVINSVYGLTAAQFTNRFRDPNNVDNIVAKRGALFMMDLKDEVMKRGFTVAHIKTDSIKIPNATPEIIEFVMDFGKRYGYTFEHEATYEKMCLVNDAVYIAKYKDGPHAGEWTATGAQFAVPYVFKTLFTREQIVFDDLCETKSVKTAIYLDMNEQLPNVEMAEKKLKNAESKYKSGKLSDISFEEICKPLVEEIATGHDYHFVGKVGQFTPVKSGCNGGLLVAEREGHKYANVTGASGYRWLESEVVRALNMEDAIDISYYTKLVDDAVAAISEHGDFEWFTSDDPVGDPVDPLGANDSDIEFMNKPE